jgi:DNA (cytosine-5)-methyltransferase 1
VEVTYLSVCSGIEAATVAWHPIGFSPVAFAEIERFPCAVLQHHYPDVPNWGDLTKFKDWPDADIDLLVGGTPCQSFSVAGLREGLADPRGNLALTYLAVADRYRPRWLLWENVPGVLSSDDGRAFGSILGGLAELGYGFAYRVLDAQYFGLAQRRKRVFVVGHLGDWRRAAAVLFERESLSWHPAPRREAGQTAPTVPSRSSAGGGLGTDFDCDEGLIPERARALTSSNQRIDYETETLIAHTLKADGFDASEDGTGRGTPLIAQTLTTGGDGKRGWNDPTNATLVPITLAIRGRGDSHDLEYRQDGTANAVLTPNGGRGGIGVGAIAFSAQDHGNDAAWDISPTVRKGGDGGGVQPCIAFDARQSGVLNYGDKSGPLDTDGHTIGVLHDTFTAEGISHASTQKTHAGTLLRALREEVGAEAFTQWGLGILDSLLPAEVLRSRLHGCGVRLTANFSRRWLVYHALARAEAHSEGLMQAMREAECEGCSSQGWRPPEQLARELGAYLSELSHPGAQAARFMCDLRQASEGLGLLREALSAIQEVGRSAGGEGEPAWQGMQVRRLTVEECEFLQGFPRGYTSIPYRGKPAADGPRYKALGNSMAVPCMRWIGERIALVDSVTRDLDVLVRDAGTAATDLDAPSVSERS